MLDINGLSENLKKLLNPATPSGLKMLAIKGTVPLRPVDYVLFLYQMQFDENEELRLLAEKTFSELQPKIPACSRLAESPCRGISQDSGCLSL